MTPPKPDGFQGERFTILQMVQDGTITPDEGARLLEAMDRAERTVPMAAPPAPPTPTARDVRVRITNAKGEQEVDLVLPLSLVEMGLSLASRIAPGRIPDTTEIRKSIRNGFVGTLINVNNGADRVEIIVQER